MYISDFTSGHLTQRGTSLLEEVDGDTFFTQQFYPHKKACPCPLRGAIREVVYVVGTAPITESAIDLQKHLENYIDTGHLTLARRLEELLRLRADNTPHIFFVQSLSPFSLPAALGTVS